MCCLKRPADESATIRLVNCETQEKVVRTVQTVGMAFPGFEAVLQNDIGKGNVTQQWAKPRRLAPDVRKKVLKGIDYLLKQGLIHESSSPWAAPIVKARRKNGHLRLAMDYHRLNGLALPQHHPLPLIDDLVDQLTDAKFFSTVNLKSGYYQLQMQEENASKTSFVAPDGQYEWTSQGTRSGYREHQQRFSG